MKLTKPALVALAIALAAAPASAEGPQQLNEAQVHSILASLHPQSGRIALPDAHATLDLGQAYDFYSAEDARKILVDLWQNPSSVAEGVLGLVMPHGRGPATDSWGAMVTYEASGYVSDDDAAETDYGELLGQLKEATEGANEERTKSGYPAMHLIGWAENPKYDNATHSAVWARDLKFEGAPVDSLNYDVRTLGRNGVLSINFLSEMPQLGSIRGAAQTFADHASFDKGFAYADFDPSLDKKAEYGVGGLIAAGAGLVVAKKLGLLAVFLKFLKPLIVVVLAGFAAFKNKIAGLFGRNKDPLEGDRG